MSDFRNVLYRRYVSAFKTENLKADGNVLKGFWSYWERTYLPLLNELDRDAAILEVGCGPGYLLQFLGEHGFKNAKGIDLATEQIDIAKKRDIDATVADAANYLKPLVDRFDVILAIDFLEHFSKAELIEIVGNIQRALKPNGIFIAQTPNGQGLFAGQVVYGDLTHITILNPSSLRQLLQICGFSEIKFMETASFASSVKGNLRRLFWAWIKWTANLIRRIETGKKQEIWSENMICLCRKEISQSDKE